MASLEGVYNVKSSLADGAPELNVSINRTFAGINNISVAAVIQQLEQQLQGRSVGKMDYKGEMRDILIKMPDITANELGNLVITSGNQEFRLAEIATITSSRAPKEIFRRNQARINKILADMDSAVTRQSGEGDPHRGFGYRAAQQLLHNGYRAREKRGVDG